MGARRPLDPVGGCWIRREGRTHRTSADTMSWALCCCLLFLANRSERFKVSQPSLILILAEHGQAITDRKYGVA
jgi:hypothetical protein